MNEDTPLPSGPPLAPSLALSPVRAPASIPVHGCIHPPPNEDRNLECLRDGGYFMLPWDDSDGTVSSGSHELCYI
jgi:hypothetical protein